MFANCMVASIVSKSNDKTPITCKHSLSFQNQSWTATKSRTHVLLRNIERQSNDIDQIPLYDPHAA